MIGASQSALSIQNPSQSGPRTHCGRDAEIHGVGSAISVTETDEECAVIETIAIYMDRNVMARGGVHMGRRSNVSFPQRKRYRSIIPEKAKARRLKQRRAHSLIRQFYQATPAYYWSCMFRPPPVALTARPCWVEEMRIITPA